VNLDRLEYEVRLLPHVVACAITDAQVSVLLDPRGDPDAVAVAVSGILITAGLDRPVRVMGGTPGVAALPHRRLTAPVAIGTGVGVGMLALATAVAALTGAPPFSTPARPEVKPPVAAARPNPNGPDLLHLALPPATKKQTGPAIVPPSPEPPTVVALPGELLAGGLAVASGPGRAHPVAGGPAAISPIGQPVTEPAAIPATTPGEFPPGPPSVTPVGTPTPQTPAVSGPVVATPATPTADADADQDDGDNSGHGCGNANGHDHAPGFQKNFDRVHVERLLGTVRAQVRQACRHGQD